MLDGAGGGGGTPSKLLMTDLMEGSEECRWGSQSTELCCDRKAPMGSTGARKVRWLSELFHIEVGELGFCLSASTSHWPQVFLCERNYLSHGILWPKASQNLRETELYAISTLYS